MATPLSESRDNRLLASIKIIQGHGPTWNGKTIVLTDTRGKVVTFTADSGATAPTRTSSTNYIFGTSGLTHQSNVAQAVGDSIRLANQNSDLAIEAYNVNSNYINLRQQIETQKETGRDIIINGGTADDVTATADVGNFHGNAVQILSADARWIDSGGPTDDLYIKPRVVVEPDFTLHHHDHDHVAANFTISPVGANVPKDAVGGTIYYLEPLSADSSTYTGRYLVITDGNGVAIKYQFTATSGHGATGAEVAIGDQNFDTNYMEHPYKCIAVQLDGMADSKQAIIEELMAAINSTLGHGGTLSSIDVDHSYNNNISLTQKVKGFSSNTSIICSNHADFWKINYPLSSTGNEYNLLDVVGQHAGVDLTFSGNPASDNTEYITLESYDGTVRTYWASDANDYPNNKFKADGTVNDIPTSLGNAIVHASGHGDPNDWSATPAGTSIGQYPGSGDFAHILFIFQTLPGVTGDKVIISTLANTTITADAFQGGVDISPTQRLVGFSGGHNGSPPAPFSKRFQLIRGAGAGRTTIG